MLFQHLFTTRHLDTRQLDPRHLKPQHLRLESRHLVSQHLEPRQLAPRQPGRTTASNFLVLPRLVIMETMTPKSEPQSRKGWFLRQVLLQKIHCLYLVYIQGSTSSNRMSDVIVYLVLRQNCSCRGAGYRDCFFLYQPQPGSMVVEFQLHFYSHGKSTSFEYPGTLASFDFNITKTPLSTFEEYITHIPAQNHPQKIGDPVMEKRD